MSACAEGRRRGSSAQGKEKDLIRRRVAMTAAAALTRIDRKPIHHSEQPAAQSRTKNRRRRTVPATEPKRAASEIAMPCTCATEIRAAGEVLSTRGAPAGRREGPRPGGGDRCVRCTALPSLFSFLAAASSAACALG